MCSAVFRHFSLNLSVGQTFLLISQKCVQSVCLKQDDMTSFPPDNPIDQDELSSCCLFSLSPKIHPKNILRAQLWVHLRPADMVTTVFLQISRLKPGKEGNNTRVRVRSLKIDTDASAGSWQSIDIKSLLQAWLRQPESSYGIEINAYDSRGEDLAVTSAEPGEEGLVSATKIFINYLKNTWTLEVYCHSLF